MSKRFGRNQRRRAREALAAAQENIQNLQVARRMDAALLARQRRSIDDLQSRLAEVAYLVGREAVIAGEATPLSGGFDGMRLAPVNPRPGPIPGHELRDALLEAATVEVLRLLNVRLIRDKFARQIHFRVSLAGGEVAYGISESALFSMPADALERRLAPEIAQAMAAILVHEIKRGAA